MSGEEMHPRLCSIPKVHACVLPKDINPTRARLTRILDTKWKSVTFSRDCLAADVLLDNIGNNKLALFVNHLKSQLKDSKENPDEKRWHQSTRISEVVQEHFKDIDHANFLVVGDMNATPDDNSLKPLLSQTWIEDVVKSGRKVPRRMPKGHGSVGPLSIIHRPGNRHVKGKR
jgi:hypothetical protein